MSDPDDSLDAEDLHEITDSPPSAEPESPRVSVQGAWDMFPEETQVRIENRFVTQALEQAPIERLIREAVREEISEGDRLDDVETLTDAEVETLAARIAETDPFTTAIEDERRFDIQDTQQPREVPIVQQELETAGVYNQIETIESRVGELAALNNDVDAVMDEVNDLRSQIEELQTRVSENLQMITARDERVVQTEEKLSSLDEKIADVEQAANQTGFNIHTADFVYRSVVATGGIITALGAAVVFLNSGLVAVTAALLLTAVFLGYLSKEGLAAFQ